MNEEIDHREQLESTIEDKEMLESMARLMKEQLLILERLHRERDNREERMQRERQEREEQILRDQMEQQARWQEMQREAEEKRMQHEVNLLKMQQEFEERRRKTEQKSKLADRLVKWEDQVMMTIWWMVTSSKVGYNVHTCLAQNGCMLIVWMLVKKA